MPTFKQLLSPKYYLQQGWARILKTPKWLIATAATLLIGAFAELKTSFVQSRVFHKTATGEIFTKHRVSDPATTAAAAGPYDERLGYTRTLDFRRSLSARGYTLEKEAQWLEHNIAGLRLFPVYNEKAQAGLRIVDDRGRTIHASPFPRMVYRNFESIPPMIVNSLLFVENRKMMEEHASTWNPAIEWGRLIKVITGRAMNAIGLDGNSAGASTLATQKEKFRHSPDGITSSSAEKLRQMLTASVRAYKNDDNTVDERRDIVLDYLNAMPLSAYPGKGEIHGFADGITSWFGRDFHETNRLLMTPEDQIGDAEFEQYARAYRESLSLVMAVKKPSAYLQRNRAELESRINIYLPLLADAGIISPRLRDAALRVQAQYADPSAVTAEALPPVEKSVASLQVELLCALEMNSLYDLTRLDLTVRTTIDGAADRAVSEKLKNLGNPETAAAYGLTGYRLLKPETAPDIVYAFTLYEKMPDGKNVLRVQTDNFNGPLNLNEGSKLELGSTAKLRTLISYLEAVNHLHSRYSAMDSTALSQVAVPANDRLTRWVVDYLMAPETDKSAPAMLDAALDRTYSAHTGERFFTGGGVHRFENFDRKDNGRVVTVRQAFHLSLNLPFVRIMRDIVEYTQNQKMHLDPALFTDPQNPQRLQYLNQFAQEEGQKFLWQAWIMQKDKTDAEVASLLAAKTSRRPSHLAVVFRTVYPNASQADMETFFARECPTSVSPKDFAELYENYAPGKFDLNDLGYITGVHPLSLWLAGHKASNPQATWDESLAASAETRALVYKWLFKPGKERAQNTRIRTMVEQEAFIHIHKTWKEKGFPFDKMVPSYASALGASGDNPAALSALAGILQNDGLLIPVTKFTDIDFALNTPYALEFNAAVQRPLRVLSEDITKLVRREMQMVVEQGTARRANNSIILSDGRILPVGAKTGTGDNRLQTFSARGSVKTSNAKSRTATFVYIIDDRFFGCVTAYVSGPSAGKFSFTSALPAQVFKAIAPDIQPILDKSYGVTPAAKESAENKPANAAGPKVKAAL
jgi:membrane peptidoglycan carboxypeptidase